MPVYRDLLFIFLPLVSGIISLMLAVVAFRRRAVTGAWPFMFMLLSAALWSLGQVVEVISPTLEAKIVWDNIQFIAQSGLTLSSLVFALHYTNRQGLLKRWVWGLLAIEPLAITALAWTDPAHNLVRVAPRLVEAAPAPVLVYQYGVAMWIDCIYLAIMTLIILVLLFIGLIRASRSHRLQIGAVFIGMSIPFIGGLLNIAGLLPEAHRDISPILFAVSALILAWGLFRQRLLDLAPIARAAVFEQMVDAVFVLDMQSRIVDLNPAACQLVGQTAAKLIGQAITDQFSDWPDLDKVCPDSAAAQMEITLVTKQRQCHFDLSHSPLSNRRGKRTGCLIVLRDITERRQAEEAYRVLVDHSLQGLTILQDSRIVFANPTIADFIGYSVEEITGFSAEQVFQVIHPEEREQAIDHMYKRLARESTPDRFEFRVFRKDGSIRWLETYSTTIDYHGKPAIHSAYLDITDRKITEEALRESESRYRSLVEVMPIGVAVIQDGYYVYFNPAAVKMFGYKRVEDMVGRPAMDVIAGESAAEAQERLDRLTAGQGNEPGELQVIRKDGSTFLIETRSVPIQLHGQPAFIIFGQDITARRQSEEERERLISELDAFAHTVAHNIKGPLGIVLGFADMLADEGCPPTEEHVREAASNIRTYTAKLTNIVDELLLLSSLRKDQEIPSTDLDMIVPIFGVKQRLADLIRSHEAQIDLPKSWPLARGYGPWVEEVWVNYVSNAIKYGGRPPHLELGAAVQPDGMIKFWVRDNGAGIAPEDQEKVWVPHTRLDRIRAKGDGLGLSIVERIITRLGGEVGVESEPGKGSTFSFTLPPADSSEN